MHFLAKVFVDSLITLFFVGLAGSSVVILIAFVEDFRELFGSDEVLPGVSQSQPGAGAIQGGASYTPPRERG